MTFTAEQVIELLSGYHTGAAAVWIVLPDGAAAAIENIATEPSDHESGLCFLIQAATPE